MTDTLLKEGQKKAVDIFYGFLVSDTHDTMLLQGRAGTGKSFVTKYFVDVVVPEYQKKMEGKFKCKNVYLTATTNKAVEVLAEQSGHTATTLASLLGLKVVNDHASGKTLLVPNNKLRSQFDDIYDSLIIVDEASMSSRDILTYLGKYTHNCKVLFIGDEYQINPVNEKLSLIYSMDAVKAELTEIVRTESPEIKALCEQFRDTVQNGIFKPIKTVAGVIDKLSSDQMYEKLFEVFTDRNASARVLAYTNKRVNEYNRLIRKQIRKLPDEFVAGDVVLVSNSCKLPDSYMAHVEEPLLVIDRAIEDKELWFEDDAMGRVHTLPYKVIYCISPVDKEAHEQGVDVTVHPCPVSYDPDNYNQLLKHFANKRQWRNYFKLKDTFPNLRPSESTTYHKGQGSTYDTIFLDLGSLASCNRANEVARMLYVGVSRPKTHIYLYGELPHNYGGVI